MNHMEGAPIGKSGKLPLPIKIIGCVLFGGIVLITLLGIVGNFLF
ncbi:hypothetical protein [Aquibacillus koreensis]|nr:hypothetical protein [Aquibacillus koreensis]